MAVATVVAGAIACGTAAEGSFDAAPVPPDAAPSPDAQPSIEVRAGAGIGSVVLGMRYAELRSDHGELEQLAPVNRLVLGKLPALGLEVLLASAQTSALSDDAVVLAVGVRAADGVAVTGAVRPGMTQVEVEAAAGPAPESIGSFYYYPVGVSVGYDDAHVVKRVGVFAAYELAPTPPPMESAQP
jgi:hypothetical protein